jgi:capsular polysaccharide biosynthesis protein
VRKRVVPFAGSDRSGSRFDTLEGLGEVHVSPPAAGIDRFSPGFSAVWSRVTPSYSLAACGILTLERGRFHAPSGIVSADGLFPAETIPLDGFPYSWQFLDAVRTVRATPTPIGDGYLLGLQLSVNYYHWVAEILPLLFLIEAHDPAGDLPIYLGADLPEFVREYLELLRPGRRFVWLDRGVYVAERLLVPTFPGGAEWPAANHLLAVRRNVLSALGLAPRPRRRLLISRGDALDRRILNEDELLESLSGRGFEHVTLSHLSAVEQIRLFAQAEIVVAPHGAGTANVLFAPRECRVIELIGKNRVAACFMVAASVVGQRYGYIECRERQRQLLVKPAEVHSLIAAVDGTSHRTLMTRRSEPT